MALEDVKKTTIIRKVGLFDWNVMPFGMKNATNILSRMTIEVFGEYIDKFLKMFVDDLNIHHEMGRTFGASLIHVVEVKGSQFET
jgi:hypothetical protein